MTALEMATEGLLKAKDRAIDEGHKKISALVRDNAALRALLEKSVESIPTDALHRELTRRGFVVADVP